MLKGVIEGGKEPLNLLPTEYKAAEKVLVVTCHGNLGKRQDERSHYQLLAQIYLEKCLHVHPPATNTKDRIDLMQGAI